MCARVRSGIVMTFRGAVFSTTIMPTTFTPRVYETSAWSDVTRELTSNLWRLEGAGLRILSQTLDENTYPPSAGDVP
jgi:hypothetical protein